MLFYSFILNLALMLIFMPFLIKYLKRINYNQVVSEYSLDEYKNKEKTPSMGGTLFVVFPIITTFILGNNVLSDLNVLIVTLAFLGYGLIGFVDDFIIIIQGDNKGLSPKMKLILQFVLSIIFFGLYFQNVDTSIDLLFIDFNLEIGMLYAILVFVMFVGASNAVNITDGMDGLAGGTSFIALIPFLLFTTMIAPNNLSILLSGVLGALLGYLRFNFFPAKIFMGDTGALALGGLLAATAMVLKQELTLVIIGGVFVWEVFCVVVQISSVKLFKRRVFKYTPIHYSFIISGYREKAVVYGFYLLGIILAVIGFILGS